MRDRLARAAAGAHRQNGAVSTTEIPASIVPRDAGPRQSGARSGALLAGATAVSILAAYVFLLAAGRLLGSEDYGSFAALLGLLTIIVLPAGALQMAVSREISRSLATGDERGAARLARGTLRAFAAATVPLVAITVVLAPALSSLLNIHSTPAVVVAALSLSTAFLYPVAMGVLQGEQRFLSLGSLYVIPWVVRLVVLGIAATAGYRLGGAVFATLAGALVSMAVAYGLIRDGLRGADTLSARRAEELPRLPLACRCRAHRHRAAHERRRADRQGALLRRTTPAPMRPRRRSRASASSSPQRS